jgi:hypothetical protein
VNKTLPGSIYGKESGDLRAKFFRQSGRGIV